MNADIFIKTCDHDAAYHRYCLESIDNFCEGFNQVVVKHGEHPRGYLDQMVVKLHADLHCESDLVLVTDSDTIFVRPVTPETYLVNGKPIWLITPFDQHLLSHPGTKAWFHVMEEFFGEPPEFEFMRRQPFVFPRWILAELREFCLSKHGVSITDYIMNRVRFSEWNVLGMFAWKFHRDKFHWIDTSKDPLPELTVEQFWSHDPIDKNIHKIQQILA